MFKEIDAYSLKARIFPVFIVLSPILILYFFLYYKNWEVPQAVLVFLSTLGFTFLFSQLGRDRGKRKEKEIFDSWGGMPTTQYQRYRSGYLDEITRARYHQKLKQLMNIDLSTKELEENDPDKADEIYIACTKYLINHTRDKKKFPLVFAENVNFGFRRNLWGMKSYAILIILICITILLLLKYYWIIENTSNFLLHEVIIPIIIYFIFLYIWIFVISREWIKATGFEYAKRLFESIDSL